MAIVAYRFELHGEFGTSVVNWLWWIVCRELWSSVCRWISVLKYSIFDATVEPLLKDSPNKGHHINYLPTKDTF